MHLESASANDLTAIMTDHYKSQNQEKQRLGVARPSALVPAGKEEFLCREKIKI